MQNNSNLNVIVPNQTVEDLKKEQVKKGTRIIALKSKIAELQNELDIAITEFIALSKTTGETRASSKLGQIIIIAPHETTILNDDGKKAVNMIKSQQMALGNFYKTLVSESAKVTLNK